MSDWNYYQANVNDRLASIYLDLEAKEEYSQQEYPKLFWLFIRLKVARDDGLSHDDEFDALCEYEDIIDEHIKGLPIHLVGRITTNGMRKFYFYGNDNFKFETLVEAIVDGDSSYQYQSGSKDDSNWSQYDDVLYPEEQGLKQIFERAENA